MGAYELHDLCRAAAGCWYPELYETPDGRPQGVLAETTRTIIRVLGDARSDDTAWRRMGWMAHALIVEALPTIEHYGWAVGQVQYGWAVGQVQATAVRRSLECWLEARNEAWCSLAFDTLPVHGPQALAEAYQLVLQVARVMKRLHAAEALNEGLGLCLEGYAIVPGVADRRRLFDWWLDSVVPAAWCETAAIRWRRSDGE